MYIEEKAHIKINDPADFHQKQCTRDTVGLKVLRECWGWGWAADLELCTKWKYPPNVRWSENLFRNWKSWNIYIYISSTYTMIRNIKRSSLVRRKIIPDENMDPCKGIQNTRNGNNVDKYMLLSIYIS